jgi:hypothetical protein
MLYCWMYQFRTYSISHLNSRCRYSSIALKICQLCIDAQGPKFGVRIKDFGRNSHAVRPECYHSSFDSRKIFVQK